MIIYGVPLSQPVRAVLWLLHKNKIPYKLETAVPGSTRGPRGGRSAEYLKLSPSGLVPCMDDDGFLLFESAAIMQYVCEKHNLADYPRNIHCRALVNQYLHWHHTNTRRLSRFFASYVRPDLQIGQLSREKAQDTADSIIKIIETFLETRPYLGGDAVTIADLQCYMEVVQGPKGDFFSLTTFPKTQAWFNRMTEVEGLAEVMDMRGVEKTFSMIREQRAKL